MGPAASAVTSIVADTTESRVIKMRTTVEDGWTNDIMVEDSSRLAGFTDTEAAGVSPTF